MNFLKYALTGVQKGVDRTTVPIHQPQIQVLGRVESIAMKLKWTYCDGDIEIPLTAWDAMHHRFQL